MNSLQSLADKFKFNALQPEYAQEIRRIGRNYIIDRRLEDEDDERPSRSRKSYRAFLKVTEPFLEWLKNSYEHSDFFNVATEMLLHARNRKEPEPQRQFPTLTEHQRNVEAHYRELLRLTELLRATLVHRIESLKPKRGPKPDFALQHLVMSSAEFWTVELCRRFTVDYHEGSGLTHAFEFVRAVLDPPDKVAKKKRYQCHAG